jgi:cell division protein FtsW
LRGERSTQTPVRGHHPDYVLALGVVTLLAIGLVVIYSVSPILSQKLVGDAGRNFYFLNQLKFLFIGAIAWFVAQRIPYRRWQQLAPWLMGISVFAILLLFTPLRDSSHGATRWIRLGPLSMQPAELLKISLIIYLAAWFERRKEEIQSFWDGVFPFLIMVGLACFVVVVFQKDMGTTLVILLSALGMYFAAGLSWKYLIGVGGLAVVLGLISITAFPHRVERVATFLNLNCNQSATALGNDYHVCQALIAIGSGGVVGLGLGNSIQVWGYLPEAANDSIFAIIGEEFGTFGSLAVIGLFGLIVYRGLQVARDAPDAFSRLIATGISLWLLFQALINISAMLALIPLTGIPLPFISYGGSSLIITLFGVGMLLQISRFTIKETRYAGDRERRGNRRPYFANPGNGRRPNVAR